MTSARFGQSACLGLWLLSANHGILGSLSAILNLGYDSVNGPLDHFSRLSCLIFPVDIFQHTQGWFWYSMMNRKSHP